MIRNDENPRPNPAIERRTGSATPDDYEGRVPLSEERVQYVQAQIDGDLLDVLHAKWQHSKGVKAVPKTNWDPRAPGDLVG